MPGHDPKQHEIDRINAEALGRAFDLDIADELEKAKSQALAKQVDAEDAARIKDLEERLDTVKVKDLADPPALSSFPVPAGLEELREMLRKGEVVLPKKQSITLPYDRVFVGIDHASGPDVTVATPIVHGSGNCPLTEDDRRSLAQLLASELTRRNRWMEGMRYVWISGGHGTHERVSSEDYAGNPCAPGADTVDIRDEATVGCLLHLLADVWPFYGLYGTCDPILGYGTRIVRFGGIDVERDVPNISYFAGIRGEAVMRALLSGWGVVS